MLQKHTHTRRTYLYLLILIPLLYIYYSLYCICLVRLSHFSLITYTQLSSTGDVSFPFQRFFLSFFLFKWDKKHRLFSIYWIKSICTARERERDFPQPATTANYKKSLSRAYKKRRLQLTIKRRQRERRERETFCQYSSRFASQLSLYYTHGAPSRKS